MKPKSYLLPIIVLAQFAGTSLWFAGNAIVSELVQHTSFTGATANITAVVQFGFIAGTLVFALWGVADRFNARSVFVISSVVAALSNLLIIWLGSDYTLLLTLRFVTGFFLAGIYPVGMKIASDLFPKQLGNALGFLVGALVLGTAFPHLLRSELEGYPWQRVILFTSVLATIGGVVLFLFTPPSPTHDRRALKWHSAFSVFRQPQFRSAAFGYFGHMWELYTFWAFVPIILALFNQLSSASLNVPLYSFLIIGIGAIGCIAGGLVSKSIGSRKVAIISLLISGICCIASPFIFFAPGWLFVLVLLVWGITVVADSPQFSTLVAKSAALHMKGTALTMVTSIGFTITIVSIQALRLLFTHFQQYSLLALAIGPIFGLMAFYRYRED